MKWGSKGVYASLFLSVSAILAAGCEETPSHKYETLGPSKSANAVVEAEGKDQDSDSSTLPPATSDGNNTKRENEPVALNGKQLYADLCATCHGALEQSEHAGKNAEAIKAAIGAVPDMSGLKDLSDAKIAVIGGELSKVVPAPGGGGAALDGMKLYMDNCMGCHGPKAQTTVDVKTVEAVKAARINIPEMAANATPDPELMALLKYLTDP